MTHLSDAYHRYNAAADQMSAKGDHEGALYVRRIAALNEVGNAPSFWGVMPTDADELVARFAKEIEQ